MGRRIGKRKAASRRTRRRATERREDAGVEGDKAVENSAETSETYTVKSGDTLSDLAMRCYGDASAYMRIYEANRTRLDNPDVIHPGMVLTIPR